MKEYCILMHAVLGEAGIQLIAFIKSPVCVVMSTLPVASPRDPLWFLHLPLPFILYHWEISTYLKQKMVAGRKYSNWRLSIRGCVQVTWDVSGFFYRQMLILEFKEGSLSKCANTTIEVVLLMFFFLEIWKCTEVRLEEESTEGNWDSLTLIGFRSALALSCQV